MKVILFLILLHFSTKSLAEQLQINCDSNQTLQSIGTATAHFKFDKESKADEQARWAAENLKLEAKSNTAIQCLNQLKLSQQDQKTLTEVNQVLTKYASNKGHFIRDQKELDRQMKKLDAQIQSCEIPELMQPKPRIEIKSSATGLNKNKNGSYEPESFERIIEAALQEGVDPFLALSIVLLENPPTIGNGKSDEYRQNFGTVPVDSIAAYDMMGCFSEKAENPQIEDPAELKALTKLSPNALHAAVKKFKKPEIAAAEVQCEQYKKTKSRCSSFFTGQKAVPLFDITSIRGDSEKKIKQYRLCSRDFSAVIGKFANFEKPGEALGPKNCCADIKSNLSSAESHEEFLGRLGLKYVKNKVQDCASKAELTYCVQKYNGLGCFNCSRNQEQMKSDCLHGMVMSDRPVYGARAMDLMVNSLMTNRLVEELVLKVSRRTQSPVISILCFNKPGQHKIDSASYEKEQKEYLLNGQHHAYKFHSPSSGGPSFKENKSDRAYQAAETQRQKACAKYF